MILIDNFVYDAALSEEHTLESETTDFPTEDGADLTDHIIKKPREWTCDGIVSDTPIGTVALLRDLDGGSPAAADGQPVTLPSEEALSRLEEIYDQKRPVTVQTGLGARKDSRNQGSGGKVYERMVMTSLKIPRDKDTGNALRFNATFKQITKVTNLRTTVPTATPGGSGRRKLGTKPVVGTDAPIGSTLVYTIRRAPIGSTGGFTAINGVQYASKPVWLEGDPGVPVSVDGFGDHFKVGPGQTADGYVLNFKYTPFKREIVMAAPGGQTVKDETGRIWHAYPIQKPPADPNTPVAPDQRGTPDNPDGLTNAQEFQRLTGKSMPGL